MRDRRTLKRRSEVYDEVNDEHMMGERNLLLPPSHPMHDVGATDIKRKSEYAAKVLMTLRNSHKAHTRPKGKQSKNQLASVVKTWVAFPGKVAKMAKQKAAIKMRTMKWRA
jgi:hypothetical protein